MDAQRRWDLMRTYEEMLAIPDPPHGFLARFAQEASTWIASLETEDRDFLFAYLGVLLERPGEFPLKTKTLWVLSQLPAPESEALLVRFLQEGRLRHGAEALSFAASAQKTLYG